MLDSNKPDSPENEEAAEGAPSAKGISRRRLLIGGTAGAAAALPVLGGLTGRGSGAEGATVASTSVAPHVGHGGGNSGATFQKGSVVDHKRNGFHPTDYLREFDYGKTTRLASGRVLREWTLVAADREIEVAPGVFYPAWMYNGQVPGPTLRAREGDLLRIRLINASQHPHTIHFHGLHPSQMDGVPGLGAGLVETGEETTYEFEAAPFGLHLYHCHSSPLAEHIARGLYGTFIIDPREGRPEADEMVMMMNGFNTNFDAAGNQIYAVNTVAFHYANEPIQVARSSPVRVYLVNILEYDPINSFHIHGNFFHHFPTGTSLTPVEFTDTLVQAQGQRGILELEFPYSGDYMFHAHKSEFAELGWMGFFCVGGDANARATAPAAFCDLSQADEQLTMGGMG